MKIRVEPDEDLRPGVRLLTPTTSLHAPRLSLDHCRQDFRVRVGRKRSSLAAVCLGPQLDRGDPEQRIARFEDPSHMQGLPRHHFAARVTGGQPALGMRVMFPRKDLVDWHLSYAGWAYVVGVVIDRRDDLDVVLELVARSLDTWRWLVPKPYVETDSGIGKQ